MSGSAIQYAPTSLKTRLRMTAQRSVALAMDMTGINWWLFRRQLSQLSPFIRLINYHDVPPCHAETFNRQLEFLKRRYVPTDRAGLMELLAGRWRHDRPGLLISFDDGLKSHSEVAAPLLEKHGMTGWFFVPTEFVDTPRSDQRQYGREHRISWSEKPDSDLGAMSWDDVRRLDRAGHVIGCHTTTHVRLSSTINIRTT